MISSEDDIGAQEIEDDAESAARGEAAGGPLEKVSRTRRIPPEVPVFLFYLLAAAFLTWPVAAHFSRTVYGFPSDNLGQLWTWWWVRNASSFGGSASFSPLIGFPFGQRLPLIAAEFVSEYTARFLLLFTTQTVVYNLFVTSSFFLSGMTMYYLVRYITADRVVAFFGGLAFLVSAYHAIHATFSVNLALTEFMPLFILMLLIFMKRPSTGNAVLLFVTAVLVVGTSVHYGLFMAVFAGTFLFGYYVYRWMRVRHLSKVGVPGAGTAPSLNEKTLLLSLAVIFAVVVIVIPLFYANQASMNQAGNYPTRAAPGSVRNLDMDVGGSATPLAYVLPEQQNRFLGWITRNVASNRVGFYANSLYLGLAVMLPAILAIVLLFRRKRDDGDMTGQTESGIAPKSTRPRMDPPEYERALAWGLLFSAVVAFVLSMPPYFHIGSVKIWLPSVVISHALPWLRWYLRFGVVLEICLILLACLGLNWLRRERGRRWTLVLVAFLSVFVFLECIIVPPFKYFTLTNHPPGIFSRVEKENFPGGLVIYPAFEPGFFNSQRYMNYQQAFKKPMLNGAFDNSDGEALRRTVYNPYNPQTPAILSRMRLNRVVYLDNMFEHYEGTEKSEQEITHIPPGLEVEQRVKSDDMFGSGYLFKVTAPAADLVPIYQGDITVPHIDKGRITVRLIEREGILKLVNYAKKPLNVRFMLPVTNLGFEHSLVLTQDGNELWRGKLEDGRSTVIDVPALSVPAGGTELYLDVSGTESILSHDEAGVFGTETASVKIGDVATAVIGK